MHSVKRLSAFLVTAAAIAALTMPSPALADDSDIFGANIQPNVLILIDNSGSMDDYIDSIPYDEGTTFPVVNKCGSLKNSPCDISGRVQGRLEQQVHEVRGHHLRRGQVLGP